MFMKKIYTYKVDLLQGKIFPSLLLFALPLFISNIFQQLYNTVDVMIVGNVLGDTSLAAIGSATSIYDLLVGFSLGIGNGLAMVVARSFGSKDETLLKKAVASSIVIGIVVTIVVTIIGQIMVYPLLQVLNTPTNIIDEAYGYISIITMFIIVMFAYNLCAGLLRAIGNSFMPLVFLIISSCINVGLDIVCIRYLGMGVQGAAIATVISQGISVILCILYIGKKSKLLVPKKEHFTKDKDVYRELLEQGFSMGFMNCIVSAGSLILQYGINGLGYLTIAGHTAARKLYQFCMMPMVAMAIATSTFVSQNKGANQGYRIREAIRYVIYYNIVVAGILTIVLGIFAPAMVKLISGSSETVVLENGALYLRVVAPFYAVLGILLSLRYALQGLGKKLVPLVSSCIEFFGKVLFVIVFIPTYQYMAVIFCEPVIWCVMVVQLLYSFYTNPYLKEHKNPVLEGES